MVDPMRDTTLGYSPMEALAIACRRLFVGGAVRKGGVQTPFVKGIALAALVVGMAIVQILPALAQTTEPTPATTGSTDNGLCVHFQIQRNADGKENVQAKEVPCAPTPPDPGAASPEDTRTAAPSDDMAPQRSDDSQAPAVGEP
jgi:hypothetical protein